MKRFYSLVLPLLAFTFLEVFEARNSASIAFLTHNGGEVVQMPRYDRRTLLKKRPCPICNGQGRLVKYAPDEGQFAGRIGKPRSHSSSCRVCFGHGSLIVYPPLEMLREQAQSDWTQFKLAHIQNGDKQAGEAFIPLGIAEFSGKPKLKATGGFFGKPCTACKMTGLVKCGDCHGEGTLPCPAKNCKDGFIVPKKEHGRKHAPPPRIEPCATCELAGKIRCRTCSGEGAILCTKCNSAGFKSKL